MKILISGLLLFASSLIFADQHQDTIIDLVREGDLIELTNHLKTNPKTNLNFSNPLSPLVLAVAKSNGDILKLLIKNGADVNYLGNQVYSAIALASSNGDINMLKILLKEDILLDEKNIFDYGHTPAMQAAINGHLDVIKLLVSAGANLNAQDSYGDRILAVSSYNGQIDIIQYLLEQDIKINHTNNYGLTALDHANGQSHTEAALILKSSGALVGNDIQ